MMGGNYVNDFSPDHIDHSHAKYTVAAVPAPRLVRQRYRHLDVLLHCVRVHVADGICRRQPLHGPRGHQIDERLL
jgi:hypothetical protein